MPPRLPLATLRTHEVVNTPPPLRDQDLWQGDPALRHWAEVSGAHAHSAHLAAGGQRFGREEVFDKARLANRYPPELCAFDRFGMRLNAVEFHPAYHDLMRLAVENGLHNFAWQHEGDAGHVGHAVLTYMFAQPEGGVLCPMSMTYSSIPALRHSPELAAEWTPRILSNIYDGRDIPAGEKTGALVGMFMTEKQGGSDLRTNSTEAEPIRDDRQGPGAGYLLRGHKFFCSAPMCDAFLVLARTSRAEGGGLSCFLVPRWKPDGTRNNLMLQRLKDKLGNRSNASSEMEFDETYGEMLGEEGRGIRTIIDMVNGNRIYCAMASAGVMRQALVQALHHTLHRSAFQKRLIDQPLMRNTLADMAIEVEAALALGLRVAQAMDADASNAAETGLARLGTALAKFWICKRATGLVSEALECHGGPGYVEDSIMPRLLREAPLNSIWEGSGNVIALDVMRSMVKEPDSFAALQEELSPALGRFASFDCAVACLRRDLDDHAALEMRMRSLAQDMTLCWQAALLIRHGEAAVAEAFCDSRLSDRWHGVYGCLPAQVDFDAIIARARATA